LFVGGALVVCERWLVGDGKCFLRKARDARLRRRRWEMLESLHVFVFVLFVACVLMGTCALRFLLFKITDRYLADLIFARAGFGFDVHEAEV
jgi:ABC-type Fe3+ transport system permease subunit